MENEKLEQIIDELETLELENWASVAIIPFEHYSDHRNGHRIRANQQGLVLLAKELLTVVAKTNTPLDEEEHGDNFFELDAKWQAEQSEIDLRFVEVISEPPAPVILPKQTLKELLGGTGCVLAALLLVVATLAGLWTIGKWLVDLF